MATTFFPNLAGAFDRSQRALDLYMGSLEEPSPASDLGIEQLLRGVGHYIPFDWKLPAYEGPGDYQAYQYALPDVQGVVDEYFDLARTRTREDIARDYAGNTQRLVDQMTIAPTRKSQALALLANQGIEQEAATRRALTDLSMQQALHNVGIAQDQQQMEFSRQQALARELLTAHQSAEENAKFAAGMQQWLQEQQASELEKKYQSKYSLAQDLAQSRMNIWEADRAANLDYWNALLQGQQAATQGFAQAGTYYTNLTEDERNRMHENQQPYQYPTQSLSPSADYYRASYSRPYQGASPYSSGGSSYQYSYQTPSRTPTYQAPKPMSSSYSQPYQGSSPYGYGGSSYQYGYKAPTRTATYQAPKASNSYSGGGYGL